MNWEAANREISRSGYVASVSWECPGTTEQRLTYLVAGQAVKFGFCVCGHCDLEFRLDLAGVCGQLFAESRVCWLSNLSRHAIFMLWDLEDPRQRLRLPPGKTAVPVPFELARVGIAGAGEVSFLTVFGPEPVTDSVERRVEPCQGAHPPPILNPSATYYAVLKVLCDAWIDPRRERLPTSQEVATTLRRSGVGITSRAVDHHIDYLIRRVRLDRPVGDGGQRWNREALVEMCVVQRWLEW